MTFEEWKQKNYKMWNTEQAYMLACEGTPEEENAVDKYSKMIFEAAQPKWTLCKDGMPKNGQFIIAIIKNTYDNAYYSLVGWYSSSDFEKEKYISAYISGEAMMIDDNGLNCSFIAWMPLPEAPDNIDK